MQSKTLYLFAALAGAATFAAALYFQYVEGLHPCKLCIWQRYALGAGIGGALLAVLLPFGKMLFGMIGFAGYASESAAALYHSGVEQKWWKGPQSCSGGMGDSFDVGSFGTALAKGNVPQCDEIVWTFLGLSMANWNVPIAAALALVCATAAFRRVYSSSSSASQ